MITERLRGIGSWSLRLIPETPQSVLRQLNLTSAAFGHVIVTPTHIDPLAVTPLSVARYTGVYLSGPWNGELAGGGLALWLEDADGKGELVESFSPGAQTFTQWVNLCVPDPGTVLDIGLDAGSIEAIAGSITHTMTRIGRRETLDLICDHFGAEWRTTPQGLVDAGTPSYLFATIPTVAAIAGNGGRDSNIVGLPNPEFDYQVDAEDYTTQVVLFGNSGNATANISPATSYRGLYGGLVFRERFIESSAVLTGNEAAAAQAQLNRFTSLQRNLTVSSDVYDIGRDLEPGDNLYVYDPDSGLIDTANQLQYRGELIRPVIVRVHGYTWPVRQGMGVYYRRQTGASTSTNLDLTEWVEYESGPVRLDVGSPPRKSAAVLPAPRSPERRILA